MRSICEILAGKIATKKPAVSFEFFPPKTDEGDRALFEKHIPALLATHPDFCSVTYGAGGTTRDKTLAIVDRVQREHKLPALAHLTCVNHTRDEIHTLLEKIRALDCQNILALRGDPPGGGEFQPTPGGFEFSSQLVRYIKEQGNFSIGTAGFPEGHIANRNGKLDDWKHLKEKVDAGADYIITQLFFDNADFFEFRDHLVGKLGVKVPIIPGVIAILSAAQIQKFTQLCGAKIPSRLQARLNEVAKDDEAAGKFGIEYATQQCEELLRAGVPGLHFYTLNKAPSTVAVLKNLRLA
ncbi:MAG TPA: methylenetetrahydrofolate reductase [NAD(P)H] [Candidatus Sulfotelmatobacter sp.]|jgi:methylenetetrahydrofolate reductase (NADPH)|nr:methylenetetrahydrofolate reductase [NAD(P)H] [Candidatus Sulfotelmatobacter sp.]